VDLLQLVKILPVEALVLARLELQLGRRRCAKRERRKRDAQQQALLHRNSSQWLSIQPNETSIPSRTMPPRKMPALPSGHNPAQGFPKRFGHDHISLRI